MTPKLPEQINGTLFDLMDTLAYLEDGVYEKTQQNLAYIFEVSFGEFRQAWIKSREKSSTGKFKTTKDRMLWIADELQIQLSEDNCNTLVAEEEGMWRNHVYLFDGAIPLLNKLQDQGLPIGIVSNGPVAMASLCDILGLSPLIKAFVLSSHVGVTKPDVKIYQNALNILKLNASNCIFVGDGNDRELEGAMKVGLYTIRINHPRAPYANPQNKSEKWDMEVDNLEEIMLMF